MSDAAGRYQIMAAVPGKIKTDTWDWASRANARADLAEQRADTAYKVNHTGDRGGCLVKVKQVPQSALQVADSIALRPQRAECRRWIRA
ncbi:hypothetical protein N6G06_15680, partial [Cupriavidus gilardii]|nr:hypothetical protein [Cupriavidus gilardii]